MARRKDNLGTGDYRVRMKSESLAAFMAKVTELNVPDDSKKRLTDFARKYGVGSQGIAFGVPEQVYLLMKQGKMVEAENLMAQRAE